MKAFWIVLTILSYLAFQLNLPESPWRASVAFGVAMIFAGIFYIGQAIEEGSK